MKKILSAVFLILIFGGVTIYFIASGISVLCKKGSPSSTQSTALTTGDYVSSDITECSDYFLQIDHSVNFIHTHYTRFYLIPLGTDGSKLIAVCAGENMFDTLDALYDGKEASATINGEVKALDSSTRQTVQEIQQNLTSTYSYQAPTILMYYIDLQSDSYAIQSLIAGLAVPLIVILGALAIKFTPRSKVIGNLLIIPTLGLMVYLLYFLVIVLD